jgi:hypothetical protein
VDRDRVVGYLAAMTDDEFRAVQAEARESNLPLVRRSSFAEKCGQLADITARCTDGNGYTAGIADAAAARDNPQPPEPQPEPVAQQGGFQVNRGQSSGGSDFVPINERDLNTQKIADIRAQRGL